MTKIPVGNLDLIYFGMYFKDARPMVRITEIVRLLIENQGLELTHTAASEKFELVKKMVNKTTKK